MKSELEPLESSHEEFAAVAGDELSKSTRRSCPQIAPTIRGKAENAPLMPVLHGLGDMGSCV